VGEPWLIAGLGNPGEAYAATRHNVGAMVVERLCERFGTRLRKARFLSLFAAEVRLEDVPLVLTGPGTYMNESGPPIAGMARRRRIPAARIVACHDEIDLPFGALRVKVGGSTAGHHGLDSLVRALRTPDFYRVRIGVGRPPTREANIDYVLRPFPPRQREEVALLVEEAAGAALSLVTQGLGVTQSSYNRGGAGR
jgi:PTH1 family peptidyl-tRNA hydrolase